MKTPIIEIKSLEYTYDKGEEKGSERHPALRGIDLTFYEGESVALLGRNGSGKSTLAKLISMALECDGGSIIINGKDLADPGLSDKDFFEIRKRVGMVFQNPDNQIVATVVEEDVAFGPENLGVEPSEIRARVDRALATVGMSEYARQAPHNLSGGQKQRVAIAGVLAMQSDCIIFDEATAMLDPSGRRDVMNIIRQLKEEKNITVIYITHNMAEAELADRVVVLEGGAVVKDGAAREVLTDREALRRAGLEVSQSVLLCEMLREGGLEIDAGVMGENECADAIIRALEGKNVK